MDTSFEDCALLSAKAFEGARMAVETIRAVGGRFLTVKRDPVTGIVNVDTTYDPMVKVGPEGHIYAQGMFEHALLERSPVECRISNEFDPIADLSYIQGQRHVGVSQSGGWESPASVINALARGQFALALILYAKLRPKYGYIDEGSEAMPSFKTVKKTELKYMLWANFFGPAYVEKFGRQFLMAAPGWKKEELDDGGILYVVTESYYDWWTKPPTEVLEYFKKQIPGIKLYKTKSRYY